LQPGTKAALSAYKARMGPDAQSGDLVFVDPLGRPHTKYGLAMLLRSHLEAIGLKKERPELFTSTPERRRIRIHDLRGVFTTVALANGRSESWIADRTGHRSSAMINAYKRMARTFEELEAGDLLPLVDALPELATPASAAQGVPALAEPDEGVGQGWASESTISGVSGRPQGDSNPCYSLERAVSWAGLDDGDV